MEGLKTEATRQAGAAAYDMLERGIRVRDILTREAFENAIAVVCSTGGSTNAVLHLLAIAHEAQVSDFVGRLYAHQCSHAVYCRYETGWQAT